MSIDCLDPVEDAQSLLDHFGSDAITWNNSNLLLHNDSPSPGFGSNQQSQILETSNKQMWEGRSARRLRFESSSVAARSAPPTFKFHACGTVAP